MGSQPKHPEQRANQKRSYRVVSPTVSQEVTRRVLGRDHVFASRRLRGHEGNAEPATSELETAVQNIAPLKISNLPNVQHHL